MSDATILTGLDKFIGEYEGWDIQDTFAFSFYKVKKFGGRDIYVDFELGILEVYENDGPPKNIGGGVMQPQKVVEKYEIDFVLRKV